MIDIFDLYNRLTAKVNTHQGGHARPHRNFLMWVKDINMELYQKYIKDFERSNVISDELTPFLRSINVIVPPSQNPTFDVIGRPGDYENFADLRVYRVNGVPVGSAHNETLDCDCKRPATCPVADPDELAQIKLDAQALMGEARVEKIDNARWAALAGRKSKKASFASPKATLFEGGFKLAPKGLGVVVLDYFRLPKDPHFAYTIVNAGTEDEYIQYNRAGSTQLEWSPSMIPEFLSRLEIAYGTSNRNQVVIRSGEVAKAAE